MKTKILTFIAILLIIPTYGISLIVWIYIKYRYDKFTASRVLINAAVMSYNNNGVDEIRYGINNAALPMLFEIAGGKIFIDLGFSVSGILLHPITHEFMLVTMTQSSNNMLLIRATNPENQ